ncbi:MAG: FAD-dependent oxidoreductase [Nanoarchaeota archaeon]
MIKPIRFVSEVINVLNITPEAKIFRFSVPKEFLFEPGQFITLLIDINETVERRSYSIAEHGDGFIELCINKVKNGKVSTFLHELKNGHKLTAQGPLGLFTIKNNSEKKENVFIATGTGIAPFVSMIPSLLKKINKKVILLSGHKYEDEILYDSFFRELQKKYKNFEYHTIVSRPRSEKFDGEKGRVQILIEKHIQPNFAGNVYLCGLSDMINDVEQILLSKGIKKENIIFEKYN